MRRETPSGLIRVRDDAGALGRRPRPVELVNVAQPHSRAAFWTRPASTAILLVLAIVVGYQLLSGVVNWSHIKLDDLRYGYPRSFQTDGFVGFGESNGLPTHFVALNLHKQIEIYIIPGDDPTHVRVIKGPSLFGAADDYAPVALRLVDVNQDGYPDLVVSVDNQQAVFIDEPNLGTFRALKPVERQQAQAVLGGSL